MAPTVAKLRLVVAVLILTAPLALEAQQSGRMYRIGVLESVDMAANAEYLGAFRQGLAGRGYAEGQNVVIEYRSAEDRAERFRELASELARLPVDVIVARGTPATLAAKQATHIPIKSLALRRSGPFEQMFEAALIDHQVDAFIAVEDRALGLMIPPALLQRADYMIW